MLVEAVEMTSSSFTGKTCKCCQKILDETEIMETVIALVGVQVGGQDEDF